MTDRVKPSGYSTRVTGAVRLRRFGLGIGNRKVHRVFVIDLIERAPGNAVTASGLFMRGLLSS